MRDYYYILGVDSISNEQQIKTAYRKLSVKFHPDKNDGDKFFEDRFKDIQEAYETLSNSSKRNLYDTTLNSFIRGNGNIDSLRIYEEELKRKYEDELLRRMEEIKNKYQTPEQKAFEIAEKKRKENEARRKAEHLKIFNEIERVKEIITQKENTFFALQKEIPILKKRISELMGQLNSSQEDYRDANININDLNNLKLLVKKSQNILNGEFYRKQVIDLLNVICCNKTNCLGLINEYKIYFNSDLISDLKKTASSYSAIAESLNVFIKFGIIDEMYPHKFK